MWSCRIVIPKKLRSGVLNELLTGHLEVVEIKHKPEAMYGDPRI